MAKTSPEKLAAALRANLKKRKSGPADSTPGMAPPGPETGEKAVEKPILAPAKPPQA